MAQEGGRPVDYASGDHYQVLGVSRTADATEISRAYKALALRHHPDKNPGNADAEVSFKRIAEAYAVLRDPTRRQEYDRSGGTRSYVSYEEAERMWQNFSGQAADPDPQHRRAELETAAKRKAVGAVLALMAFFWAPRTLLALLPGAAAVLVALALLSGRGGGRPASSAKWAWCALAFLVAGYVVPWAVRAIFGTPLAAAPLEGDGLLPRHGPWLGAPGGEPSGAAGAPHSGEEVLLGDGSFARIADPAAPAGESPGRGWQQRLWGSATKAVRGGQEQVVMVFSREGCPWCDRQVPVFRRAIMRRSAAGPVMAAEGERPPTAGEARPGEGGACRGSACPPSGKEAFLAVSVGAASADGAEEGEDDEEVAPDTGLLAARLRVFVLDADELPEVADLYSVQAFPTIVAWGAPGATPLMAQGYLDDSAFDQLLRAAAESDPDGAAEAAEQGAGRGKALER